MDERARLRTCLCAWYFVVLTSLAIATIDGLGFTLYGDQSYLWSCAAAALIALVFLPALLVVSHRLHRVT